MTQEDFGGDPMSVDLRDYFDKQFESLEDKFDSLEKSFGVLSEDVKALPCGEQKGEILKIQQQLDNNVKAEERDFKRAALRQTSWRIFISLIGVGWIVVQLWTKYK